MGAPGRIRALPRQLPEDGGIAAFLPSLEAGVPDRTWRAALASLELAREGEGVALDQQTAFGAVRMAATLARPMRRPRRVTLPA